LGQAWHWRKVRAVVRVAQVQVEPARAARELARVAVAVLLRHRAKEAQA
jgi:hypothetical protein